MEYADCISGEGQACLGYDTKLHVMTSLQSYHFGECGVTINCYYTRVHYVPKW